MSYRTTRRMLRRKKTHRLLLLKSAISLFGQHGYHSITVRAIAKNARSSNGSFYFYFRNKEDVFAAALERFAETIADVLHAAIAGAGPVPRQQLRAAVEHLVLLLTGSPAEARILIVESSALGARLEKIRRDIVDSHARFVEQFLTRVDPAQLALNPNLVARCLVGSVYESVHHWLDLPPEQRPTAQALVSTVADFNLRGLDASQTAQLPEKEAQP